MSTLFSGGVPASSSTCVAPVPRVMMLLSTLLACGLLANCDGSSTEPAILAEAPSEILLSTVAANLAAGESVRIEATLLGTGGSPLAAPSAGTVRRTSITWSSSNGSVAAVDNRGVVEAKAAGQATITATTGQIQTRLKVSVSERPPQSVYKLTVSPKHERLPEVGATTQLVATAVDLRGTVVANPALTWSSLDPTVARVDANGTVTAVAAGSAQITAVAGTAADTAMIVVDAKAFHIPAAIASDCSVEVAQQIQDWIASVPNGSTLEFGKGGCYLITAGLNFIDRQDLTIDGQGATLRAGEWPERGRVHMRWRRSHGITIRNMTLVGPNSEAGPSGPDGAYSHREGHHGISFMNQASNLLVEDVTIRNVWGDCLYAGSRGGPVSHLTVRRLHCDGTGRHGLGLTSVEHFLMEDSYITNVRWSAIDLEVQGIDWYGRYVRIRNNKFGPVRHHILTAGGKGQHTVHDVTFEGNEQLAPGPTTAQPVNLRSPEGYYRERFTIRNNIFRPFARPIEVRRWRDFVIEGNRVDHYDRKGRLSEEQVARLYDVHDGVIRNNDRGKTRMRWELDAASANVDVQ